MIVTSVQIKTAKTQKHLYCPVFTKKGSVRHQAGASLFYAPVWKRACKYHAQAWYLQLQPATAG